MKTIFFDFLIVLFCSCATCDLDKATVEPKRDYRTEKIIGFSLTSLFISQLVIFDE